MFHKARITALALAFSLCAAQAAQAEILITPLDVSNVSTGETAASGQPGDANGPNGETAGQSGQPGNPNGPNLDSSGPGENQMTGQILTSSGNYSTKEPVKLADSGNTGAAGAQGLGGPGQQGTAAQGTSQNVSQNAAVKAPEISAQAGVLYDATHGRFLFEKDADSKLYPASITKIMTGLLVLENANLNDTVTYSKTAVTNLESGAVTLKLAEGDQVSVKDSLYGLMLKSANEVANGLAEHVAGSISGFAAMMNEKAKALGCTNTNFVNPNGLNDPNHYTTARDMAKIAAAAFDNEELCKISSTLSYTFPATKNAGARTLTPGHKMLYPSDSRYYDGIVAGKTGYTSLAGNTLVTCTERNGVRLIAVVLKAKSTHYADTKAMLDYGYELIAAGQGGTSQGTADGTTAGTNAGASQDQNIGYHKWVQDGSLWHFELADGTRIQNQCITVDGGDYYFDANGNMVTGWQYLAGTWYFFKESGAMVKNDWRQDQGKWIYLGENGRMVTNAVIDGIYYVGADGIWVES